MLNRAVSVVQLSWAISNVLAAAGDIDSPKDTNGNKACADQEVRSIADGIWFQSCEIQVCDGSSQLLCLPFSYPYQYLNQLPSCENE